MIKVDIKGLKELDNALSKLPKNVEGKVLQSSLRSSARVILNQMKINAPKRSRGDKRSKASQKYGTIRLNLRIRNSKIDKKRGGRGVFISTGKAFWAAFLELGTRFISPKPWFFKSFSTSSEKYLDELSRSIGKGIEKEWDKLV